MQLGYGPISCQRHVSETRSATEIYQEAVELAVYAEQLGFDTVWVSEHHFVPDGFLPSLLAMCAAIASRTSQIKIGASTILLPFFDPLLVAEEAAVVDLLSGGRLIVGLGQGWRPEEIEAFGLERRELPSRLVLGTEALRKAWSGEPVGPPVAHRPVHVTPLPAQPGGPPLWYGSETEPAIRRAGEIADGWQATMVNPTRFGQGCEWALAGLAAANRDPAEFVFGLHHATFVWEEGDAWDLIRPHHQDFIWRANHMEYSWLGAIHEFEVPYDEMPEDFARELIAVGDPDEVVEQILAFQAQVDYPIDYATRTYFPGLDPAIQRKSMQLFAEAVMPKLRASSPRRSAAKGLDRS